MVEQNIIQTNFVAGQLSPTYAGRRDQARYYAGLKLCQNFIPLPSGAVTRRPPTKFIDDVPATFANMFPFQSAPTRTYLVGVSVAISSVHFYIYKREDGVTTEVHDFTSSVSDQGDIWPSASYSQCRDVMYIALNGGTKIKKLTCTDDTTWTFVDVDLVDGPYEEINTNAAIKMNAAADTGNTTIVARNKADSANVNYFYDVDVGKLIRIRHNVDDTGNAAIHWGYATITSLASTEPHHTVNVTVATGYEFGSGTGGVPDGNPTITKNWRIGSLNTLDEGHPTYCHFFENRLYLVRDNRIMGSVANDFERHSPTIADQEGNHGSTPDSAIDIKLLDLRAEKINWIHSDQVMHIGTNDARYVLTGQGGLFTPSTVGVSKQSGVGCADIRPVTIDDTLYVRFDKQALMSTDYNFRRDRYEDKNLNIFSDTILFPKVTQLAYTSYPFNIVWACLEDGTLASLTYDKEQEVLAWAIHSIRDCTINNIVALKAEDEKEVLYLRVNNLADGLPATTSLHELDLTEWEYLQSGDTPIQKLLDGYVELSDTAAVSGQVHLAGQNIVAIKDGVNYPQTGEVASNGSFTLESSIAGDFYIGIPIETRIETFPIDIASAGASQVGKKKTITQVEAILHRSLSMSVQSSNSNYSEEVKLRHPDDPVADVPPVFSGQRSIPLPAVTDKEVSLIITQAQEAPLTLLGLNYKVGLEN